MDLSEEIDSSLILHFCLLCLIVFLFLLKFYSFCDVSSTRSTSSDCLFLYKLTSRLVLQVHLTYFYSPFDSETNKMVILDENYFLFRLFFFHSFYYRKWNRNTSNVLAILTYLLIYIKTNRLMKSASLPKHHKTNKISTRREKRIKQSKQIITNLS